MTTGMVPWISWITPTVHKAGGREEAAALNGGARTRRQALKARAPARGGQRRRTCSGPQPDVKRIKCVRGFALAINGCGDRAGGDVTLSASRSPVRATHP
ncbi:hypothetical protein MUK42_15175 [Musa troglodytarum]|nr:hypothetical protein MUK42_15175 [Musa troglodytarum]